jgi:DNA-directed RNA polymerase subunit RPC12/RpoP
METKICTKCNQELPIEEFNLRDKTKGTRRSECKYCHTEYMRKVYSDKKETVSNLKSQIKCGKCGEKREYVLDFHHLNPNEKDETVARMTSNCYRIEKVLNEISKCVVLCSNCHREFHHFNTKYGTSLDDYLNNNIIKNNKENK